MTEDQIERRVARMFDKLDHRYLNSDMSIGLYDAEAKVIKDWAELQHTYRIIRMKAESAA